MREKYRLHVVAKRKKDLFSTPHKQVMSSYFLGSRASWLLLQKTNAFIMNVPCFLLPSFSFYCWTQHQMVWNNRPFGRLCQLFWLCPLPTFWPPPAWLVPLLEAEGWRDSLGTVRALLNSRQNLCVISTVLATNARHSSIGSVMRKADSIPARPHTPGKRKGKGKSTEKAHGLKKCTV